MAAEMEAAELQRKEEWQAKVVVESLRFNPHFGLKSEKPSQLDKLNDIVEGPARKKGVRIVRKVTLPRTDGRPGRSVTMKPNPPTIYTTHP